MSGWIELQLARQKMTAWRRGCAKKQKTLENVDDNELPKREQYQQSRNDATMPHHRLAYGSSTTSSLPSHYDGGKRPMRSRKHGERACAKQASCL